MVSADDDARDYDFYALANADEPPGVGGGGLGLHAEPPDWLGSCPARDEDFDAIPPLSPVDAATEAAWDALPHLHKARKGKGGSQCP